MVFRCYERFMDRMGVISGPLNVASGLLDLRGPPRIFGSWLQYRCKEAKGRCFESIFIDFHQFRVDFGTFSGVFGLEI